MIEVKTKGHLVLFVRFVDGLEGEVRFLSSHLTGIFVSLKDPHFFEQVCVDNGAVMCPGEIDLAPDAMYNAIKKTASGCWSKKKTELFNDLS